MLGREGFNYLLSTQTPLIIDGALATELEARGHDLNHPLWSGRTLKEDPGSIKQVHLDYYVAGADIAITASYQASIEGFHKHLGLDEDGASELIKQSVRLAQQAREEAYQQGVSQDRKLLVAGSVGPYGAFLADGSEYHGDYQRTLEEFKSFHRPRIQALVEADVDLLALETMPKLEEIEALFELLRDEFPTVIAWVSCTLKDIEHLSDGTSILELLKLVEIYQDQIVAVGINCVPANMTSDALQVMHRHTEIPLLCYPNSGEQWDAVTKTWSGTEQGIPNVAQMFQSWQVAGARLIGGCCRTGPDYVKDIASTFQRR